MPARRSGDTVTGDKLNPKQEAFVLAYIGEARFNATKAAQIAGYADARRYGSALKTNLDISARIADELSKRALTADEVLAELTDVATAEWRDFVQVRTHPKTGEVLDVRMDLAAKIKSLELLGKNHKLFTDVHNLSGDLTSTVHLVGVDPDDV
jgi:phage terminase small subunit